MNRRLRFPVLVAALLSVSIDRSARADADHIAWHGNDVSGTSISIPTADRATIVVLVRPGQAQSKATLDQLSTVLKSASPQVVLVVSGEKASEQAKSLAADKDAPGPIVVDPDFAFSGDLGVHVWPEIVIVDTQGKCVGRLPGLRQAGSTEILAYLDLAAGKITQPELEAGLATQPAVVEGSSAQMHLQLARQMLASGRSDQAAAELSVAMKQPPVDAPTQLLAARIMLGLHQVEGAVELLDKIPAGANPAPQRDVIRARALIQSERWPDALALLVETVKLSPEPAEAFYLLGIAYAHEQKPVEAAAAFRAAAEAALPRETTLAVESPK